MSLFHARWEGGQGRAVEDEGSEGVLYWYGPGWLCMSLRVRDHDWDGFVAAGGLLDDALDDASEAEAVGTDVGAKAVAEGESDGIDVAQRVAQGGGGSVELGGPSRLMVG